MKSSIFIAAAGAILAVASPVNDKRVMKTVIETDIVYVTVTAGEEPQSMFFAGAHKTKELPTTSSTSTTTTSTSSTPPPPPPPETPTPTPEPEPTTAPAVVEVPAPEPTTEAPAPAPAVETPTVVDTPASSPVVDAEPASSPTDFASTAVYAHNLHRVNNSAPAVSWGESYAGYAAQTAKSCKFAHDLTPGGGGYGQNIAMYATSGDAEAIGASKAISQAITNMWYNGEITLFPSGDYGQDNPDFSNFESYGHYTQVVWAGSKEIGCDAHYCPPGTMVQGMGAWFSVCNYYPAGNMGGEYGKNVLPPLGRATVSA